VKKMLLVLALVCLSGLLFAGISYAADATAMEVAKFDWNNLWKGAICGAIAALVGWFKDPAFKLADFDFEVALPTVLCGLIVGVVAAYKNIPMADAQVWIASTGIAALVNMLVKALWRRVAAKPIAAIVNPSTPK